MAQTEAAKMLAVGLQRAAEERGLSIRKLGRLLQYKQAVVLSHMASGRAPIPIDRAEALAEVLRLDKAAFLAAVVKQRHPEVDWSLLSHSADVGPADAATLAKDLETIGGSLMDLSEEHRVVLREVVAERTPARRWLSVHEVPIVEILRKCRPTISNAGLNLVDRLAVERALTGTE